MSGVFPRFGLLHNRDLRVRVVCEHVVDYYWPGTMAGDGLPVRGTRFVLAHTPLDAWRQVLEDEREARLILLRAYQYGEPPPRGETLDDCLRRELRGQRMRFGRL